MKMVDNWKQAWRWGSVQIAGSGAILGALGAGLAASTSAASLAKVFPPWAVWAGGALICACTVAGRLLVHTPGARKVGHVNLDTDT